MPRRKNSTPKAPPQPGWAVYLRTSSDENQKPELSRARQRFVIEENVLKRSELPVIDEYVDVLTGKTPNREAYQRLLADARAGKFSHVIVERADRFGRNDTEALRAIDELNEFGVAVRFANAPDLDPMAPDDRVLVTLTFSLARRESALLGIRVKGGHRAKHESGGWCGKAPDGYRNVTERNTADVKRQYGRLSRRIELDPERAEVWRVAWNLLLEDRYTLEQIAEQLHARGYTRKVGGPFVTILKNGERRPRISTLSHNFRNWAYAGWVVSKASGIPPKTVRGNWEPIVSTEEFERGLAILSRRLENRTYQRRHTYILAGMVFYKQPDGRLVRLTGSTSNAGRQSGGTAYYRVAKAGGANFQCAEIDERVAEELKLIQIDPAVISDLKADYRDSVAEVLSGIQPDEKARLRKALEDIEVEERRMARMMAAGKITETVWDGLWSEWQDKRQQMTSTLNAMETEKSYHVANLDAALEIFSELGTLYNRLSDGAKKEILRYIAEKVIVHEDGSVKLILRPPFAYLNSMALQLEMSRVQQQKKAETKRGEHLPTPTADTGSTGLQLNSTDCSQYEPCEPLSLPQFLSVIAYPKRTQPLSCLA